MDADHHLLHAHRLHCVGHHQRVNHCQVSALHDKNKEQGVKTGSSEVEYSEPGLWLLERAECSSVDVTMETSVLIPDYKTRFSLRRFLAFKSELGRPLS